MIKLADITMCCCDKCEYEKTCYRKTAKADEYYQSYYDYKLDCNAKTGFDSFIPSRIKT